MIRNTNLIHLTKANKKWGKNQYSIISLKNVTVVWAAERNQYFLQLDTSFHERR